VLQTSFLWSDLPHVDISHINSAGRNATCVFSCFLSSFNGLTKLVCPFIVAVNLILRIAATPAACSIGEYVLGAFVVYR